MAKRELGASITKMVRHELWPFGNSPFAIALLWALKSKLIVSCNSSIVLRIE